LLQTKSTLPPNWLQVESNELEGYYGRLFTEIRERLGAVSGELEGCGGNGNAFNSGSKGSPQPRIACVDGQGDGRKTHQGLGNKNKKKKDKEERGEKKKREKKKRKEEREEGKKKKRKKKKSEKTKKNRQEALSVPSFHTGGEKIE